MKVTKKLKLLLTSALAVCCIATAAVGVSMASNTTASAAVVTAQNGWTGLMGTNREPKVVGGVSDVSGSIQAGNEINILEQPGSTIAFNMYVGDASSWSSIIFTNGKQNVNGTPWTQGGKDETQFPWHSLAFWNGDSNGTAGLLHDGRCGGTYSGLNGMSNATWWKSMVPMEIHIGQGQDKEDPSWIKIGGNMVTHEANPDKNICLPNGIKGEFTVENKELKASLFPDGCYLGLCYNAGSEGSAFVTGCGSFYASNPSHLTDTMIQAGEFDKDFTVQLNVTDESLWTDSQISVKINGHEFSSNLYTISEDHKLTIKQSAMNAINVEWIDSNTFITCELTKGGKSYGVAATALHMLFEAPPKAVGSENVLFKGDDVKLEFTYDGSVNVEDEIKIVHRVGVKTAATTLVKKVGDGEGDYTLTKDGTKYTITLTKDCVARLYETYFTGRYTVTFGKHTMQFSAYRDENIAEYGSLRLREGIDYTDDLVQDEFYTTASLLRFSEEALSSRAFYEEGVDITKPITVEFSTLTRTDEWMMFTLMNEKTMSDYFSNETSTDARQPFGMLVFGGEKKADYSTKIQGMGGFNGDFSYQTVCNMKNNIVEIFIGADANDSYIRVNGYELNSKPTVTQANFPGGKAYVGMFFNNQTENHTFTLNNNLNAPAITAPQADRDYAMDLGAAKDFTLTMLNADGTLELKDETGTALSESEFSYADGKLTIKAAYFQRRLFKKEGTIYVWNSTTQKGTAFKLAFSHSGIQTATIGFTSNSAPTDTVFELSGVTNVDYVLQNGEAVDAANYSFDSGKLTLKAAAIKNEIGAQEFIVGSSGKLYPCYVLANAWNNGIASTGTVAAETNGYVLTDLASFTQQKVYDLTAGYTFGFDLRTIATYRENGLNSNPTNLSLKFFDPYTGYTLYITLYANYADEKIGSSTPALYLEYGIVDSEGATVQGSSKGTRNVTAETAKAIHSIQIKENKGGLTLTVNGRDYNIGESALVGFNFKACVLSGDTTASAAGSVVALSIQEGLVDVGGTTPGGDPTPPPAEHEHTFSDQWTYDENNHWHAATCDDTTEKKDTAAHTFGDDGKCTVCGYERGTTPPPTEEPSKGCGTIALGGSGWGGGIALGILAVGAALVMFLRKKRA